MFYAENYAGFKKILERVKYYNEQAKAGINTLLCKLSQDHGQAFSAGALQQELQLPAHRLLRALQAFGGVRGEGRHQGRAADGTFLVLAYFRVLLKGLPRPDPHRRGPGRFPEEGLCPWPFCQALTELAAGRMSTEATL